jgi:hypothetical protein
MRSLIWLFIILIHFISCINCETIVVTVGERGLFFSPQNITARVSDVIKFTFYSGKHQIVQSDGPAGSCIKSSNLNSFASALQEGGEYNYIIPKSLKTDTLFYFCAYSSHCDYGMWGTIKIDQAPAPSTLDPPDPPSETTEPVSDNTNSDNLPIIIGSAIGGFFTLSILGLIVFMLYRRKKYQKQFEMSMQPYDPKFGGDGGDGGGGGRGGRGVGDNDLSHVRGSTGMASVSTLENTTLTRSNTYNRGEPNQEVIMQNNQNQPYEQTIGSYDDRTSMEYSSAGSINRGSKRESLSYNKSYGDFNNGEGSRLGFLSPPPQYDGDVSYQQQPPIPPRPTNIAPTQFNAPYVPPRPIAVSRYPPQQQQYGPSISAYQEPQFSTSPDPYGPANPGQNYPQNILPRQYIPPLPSPPPTQPLPPVPSQQLQPIPPPPSQQQTGQYFNNNLN